MLCFPDYNHSLWCSIFNCIFWVFLFNLRQGKCTTESITILRPIRSTILYPSLFPVKLSLIPSQPVGSINRKKSSVLHRSNWFLEKIKCVAGFEVYHDYCICYSVYMEVTRQHNKYCLRIIHWQHFFVLWKICLRHSLFCYYHLLYFQVHSYVSALMDINIIAFITVPFKF